MKTLADKLNRFAALLLHPREDLELRSTGAACYAESFLDLKQKAPAEIADGLNTFSSHLGGFLEFAKDPSVSQALRSAVLNKVLSESFIHIVQALNLSGASPGLDVSPQADFGAAASTVQASMAKIDYKGLLDNLMILIKNPEEDFQLRRDAMLLFSRVIYDAETLYGQSIDRRLYNANFLTLAAVAQDPALRHLAADMGENGPE